MNRIDQLLVLKGLAPSRMLAQKLIRQACVSIKKTGKWQLITKPSFQVEDDIELKIEKNELQKYVSRAGFKLEGALIHTQFSVSNLTVLDIGQSTGGFTDCLLQRGVKQVIGVDVGHGQLHPTLREDDRVICFEGVNARVLSIYEPIQKYCKEIALAVMDLSFISQKLVLPELPTLLPQAFHLISLVKPQFEVGKEGVGKGGIVKDTHLYSDVEQGIRSTLSDLGFRVLDYFASPIEGGDGNKEFFVYAQKL